MGTLQETTQMERLLFHDCVGRGQNYPDAHPAWDKAWKPQHSSYQKGAPFNMQQGREQ